MSFWARIFGDDGGGASVERDPTSDFWFKSLGHRGAAGVSVTRETARQVPVVRDCLQCLGHSVAGLSSGLFERVGAHENRAQPLHPLGPVLRSPNGETTSFEFWAQFVDDLATVGDHFAELIYSGGGILTDIWRIDPSLVTVERLPNRERRWRVREPGQAERVLVEGEMWHTRLPPVVDGLVGTSTLYEGREAIGAAIALQEFGSAFFKNDATPPFVFKHASSFADEDSKKNFLRAWIQWTTGRNRGKPGVLEHNIQIEKLGTTNEEAQFLETRKELAVECARLWRMPPHKVGILDKATFSNIEQQSLEFVVDTLTPWLSLIEASVNKQFLDVGGRYFFEFNVASLLRGDLKSRYEAYSKGRQWGWLSVNEIRRLENMNGIGVDGDRYIEPLNMGLPGAANADEQKTKDAHVAFLRATVRDNGGRPALEVIEHAA
ncbi:MAG: phage portal protein [Pikeienuella sp.]